MKSDVLPSEGRPGLRLLSLLVPVIRLALIFGLDRSLSWLLWLARQGPRSD